MPLPHSQPAETAAGKPAENLALAQSRLLAAAAEIPAQNTREAAKNLPSADTAKHLAGWQAWQPAQGLAGEFALAASAGISAYGEEEAAMIAALYGR